MTWHEVNSMKPGTRVVVEQSDRSYDVGTILIRSNREGWKFDRLDGDAWSCDPSDDYTFRDLPNGWGRNNFVYRVMHREGRNRL